MKFNDVFANAGRKIELAANLGIILVACLLGAVLVKDFLFKEAKAPAVTDGFPNRVGTNLAAIPIKWTANQQTLVMALSNNCHFCTESAPFYNSVGVSLEFR